MITVICLSSILTTPNQNRKFAERKNVEDN